MVKFKLSIKGSDVSPDLRKKRRLEEKFEVDIHERIDLGERIYKLLIIWTKR